MFFGTLQRTSGGALAREFSLSMMIAVENAVEAGKSPVGENNGSHQESG